MSMSMGLYRVLDGLEGEYSKNGARTLTRISVSVEPGEGTVLRITGDGPGRKTRELTTELSEADARTLGEALIDVANRTE